MRGDDINDIIERPRNSPQQTLCQFYFMQTPVYYEWSEWVIQSQFL